MPTIQINCQVDLASAIHIYTLASKIYVYLSISSCLLTQENGQTAPTFNHFSPAASPILLHLNWHPDQPNPCRFQAKSDQIQTPAMRLSNRGGRRVATRQTRPDPELSGLGLG